MDQQQQQDQDNDKKRSADNHNDADEATPASRQKLDESSSRRGQDKEQFNDEHEHEESESAATAAAAQQVLNSIVLIDEKAIERDIRALVSDSTRRPRKVKSDPTRTFDQRTPNRHPPQPFSHSESSPSTDRRHRVVQFSVTPQTRRRNANQEDDEDEQSATDVNLLHLAAERSHGIIRDIDSSAQDTTSNNGESDVTSGDEMVKEDLLRGSAYDPGDEKLRHMDQQPNPWQQQQETDADAKAKALMASAASAATSSNPSPQPQHNDLVPGAYQASPGMAIQRAPSFHTDVLRHPSTCMDDGTQSTVRSSSNIMPDPTSILQFTQSQDTLPTTQTMSLQSTTSDVISAVRVDEDDLEMHIRDEITNSAAQAEVVDLEKETSKLVESKVRKVRKRYYAFAAVAFVLVSLIITGMVFGILELQRKVDHGETLQDMVNNHGWGPTPPLTTLDSIRQRGYLNCGLTKRDESITFDDVHLEGLITFNEDICIAIAAAALGGGNTNVTFIVVTEEERWKCLENGTLDVLLVGTPAISESLHWNLDPKIPVQFSTPYIYDGVGAAGMPEFMENCATNRGFDNYADCRELKVCVVQGSKSSEITEKRLHPSQVVEVSHMDDLYLRFEEGCCNVIATDYSNDRAEVVVRNISGYTGPYTMGEGLYTRQPYAAATRKFAWTYKRATVEQHLEDPHTWSEFVNWVINCLIAAEEANITQETAYKFRQTRVFGEEYKNMFRDAIAAVGHYGEIYDRNRAKTVPRAGMNMLNDGTTGLHHGRSIGSLTDYGPPPYDNGTLANILVRGKLRCGMAMPQYINSTETQMLQFGPGDLAKMQAELMSPAPMQEIMGTANIDFDYCRALSSAIFQGRLTIDDSSCSASNHLYGQDDIAGVPRPTLDLIMLKDEADGFRQLDRGTIDVIAGYGMNLQSDVWKEPFDEGFTFTQPYFFGPIDGHVTDANRCMVTRQHDQQWSDYVQLVVASLFFAEQGDCTQASANDMPVVNRFGPMYKRMLRDVVFAVGNYAQLYARSVEPVYPRKGTTNELNIYSTPEFASMPGLLKDWKPDSS